MGTEEALERLYRRHRFGIKLGLHVEEALLQCLGHPERSYGCIHVTGTNGKGSVCAMIASMLTAAGKTPIGMYTSPHLVRFHERIQVNGQNVSDQDLDDLLNTIEPLAGEVARAVGQEPTFFECSTAMAFEYFRRRNVGLAVIEVGMGGRLDATNVIEPLVSVITDISLEHTAYLGNTVEAIAAEKAGIVKAGRPVVVGMLPPEAEEIVRRVAGEKGSPVVAAGQTVGVSLRHMDFSGMQVEVSTGRRCLGRVRLPLVGRFQVRNLAVALAAMETVEDVLGISFDDEVLRKGIEGTVWPARCQVLERDPPVILDGGHNPGAAKALAETLGALLGKKRLGLVVGMCADKDVRGFLKPFAGMARLVWVVPIPNERNMPGELIRAAAENLGLDVRLSTLNSALTEARDWARTENAAVCICGSLYLAGEVLKLWEEKQTGRSSRSRKVETGDDEK
ncbi:MAG: bifunctional folylpolyglutamate synthase/dihydrofolate synthase [Kiritimatiellae bacterium]|nr:bifunctional folylpolyglutamate synthase/dihydrofolate synthase [Kiritimatiellia bacterium]